MPQKQGPVQIYFKPRKRQAGTQKLLFLQLPTGTNPIFHFKISFYPPIETLVLSFYL
jgi:hypothetical protein